MADKKTKKELQALFDDAENCFGKTYDESECLGEDPCNAADVCPLWKNAGGDPDGQAEAAPAATPEPEKKKTTKKSAAPVTGKLDMESLVVKLTDTVTEMGLEPDVRATSKRTKLHVNGDAVFTIQRTGMKIHFPSDRASELGLGDKEWEEKYKAVYLSYDLGWDRIAEVVKVFLSIQFAGGKPVQATTEPTETAKPTDEAPIESFRKNEELAEKDGKFPFEKGHPDNDQTEEETAPDGPEGVPEEDLEQAKDKLVQLAEKYPDKPEVVQVAKPEMVGVTFASDTAPSVIKVVAVTINFSVELSLGMVPEFIGGLTKLLKGLNAPN